MSDEEVKEKIKEINALDVQGKYAECEALAKELLQKIEPQSLLTIEVRFIIARSSLRQGKYEQALYYAREAEQFLTDETPKEQANILRFIAVVHDSMGDFELANQYLHQALQVAEKINDTYITSSILISFGVVYANQGLCDLAIEKYAKALALSQELNDVSKTAMIFTNIGNVYKLLGSYEEALKHFLQSIAIYEQLGENSGIANTKLSMGVVYRSLEQYDKAIENYAHAAAFYLESGAKSELALTYSNMGVAYMMQKMYDESLLHYQKSLGIYEDIGSKSGIALVLSNIGMIFYPDKESKWYDPSKAEEYLKRSMEMNQELGIRHNLMNIKQALSQLYEQIADPTRALDYYKQYHALEKEVQSEAATKQAQLLEHRRKIEESERDRQIKFARFQEQEKILHNILPAQIAERMVQGETTIAESYQHVSVFFSDIVSFTELSQSVTAEELVALLNGIFSHFDQLARKHGLEKIKTIGDAYMAVAGAPVRVEDHAARAASFAVDVANFMENYRTPSGEKIGLRIGLHTGSVVAGIIGENKFAYDLWGDAVNTASRMESYGEAGKIHCSVEFMNALSLSSFQFLQFQERGEIEVKGKGLMKTYFLEKV